MGTPVTPSKPKLIAVSVPDGQGGHRIVLRPAATKKADKPKDAFKGDVARKGSRSIEADIAARWLIVDGGDHVNRLRPTSTAIVCPGASLVERCRTVSRKRHSQVLRAGVNSTAI